MSEELPPIEIDRRKLSAWWHPEAAHLEPWPMALAGLCTLVAALPDEQLIEVLDAAGVFESGKRVAEFGFAQMRLKQDAMRERDALAAENAQLKALVAGLEEQVKARDSSINRLLAQLSQRR